ncbi:hypothetical protein [Roseisolibacter agri]|uniref:Uncharacterized protein n=1 Tax=Roseisolibacter agri TaxID=2014610 RepID=A0AA37Q364_9BACT|nr:hypothetical protein [Roseisolibacter agri]GLC25744.1 hypothetical protein rosag_22570 [Roseisolibacter agri]
MTLAVLGGGILAACTACARPGAATRPAGRCAWPAAPEILAQRADTAWQRWTLPADALPTVWDPAALPALRAFRDTVAAALGATDARTLLQRQIDHLGSRPDSTLRREAGNGRLVRDGVVGTLRPIGCLEALLIDAQAARFPMAARPTELQALLLHRAATGERPAQLRVYQAASGAPWPPKLDPLMAHVARDRADGWTVRAHLHNHPFYLEKRDADVAGANAPSLSDVQLYRWLRTSLGLESAWVTNGFTTVEIPARDFDRLDGHR